MNITKILLAVSIVSQSAYSEDFNYFEKRIDYFSNVQKKPIVASKEAQHPKKNQFDWQKYMDPSNTEFFKEGEHTPPEPFMEVARNPTDQNLRMWFAYIDKKNQIANRFQLRMGEFIRTNADMSPPVEPQVPKAPSSLDINRFKFRLFFDSSCPHCKKMFKTMTDLKTQGFMVEGRQTDGVSMSTETVGFNTAKAQKEELFKHQIQSVPFLLIADRKSKAVMKISGFQSTEEVLQKLKKFDQ